MAYYLLLGEHIFETDSYVLFQSPTFRELQRTTINVRQLNANLREGRGADNCLNLSRFDKYLKREDSLKQINFHTYLTKF